jgi:hypothetical protein
VNTKPVEHAATAPTPTEDSENDAIVIANAENNPNTILVSQIRQKDPIRNTPGAFSIDGGTPIRRGIFGMLTPMPPNNYSHTPSTFHSEQLLALSDDSLTCDVSGAPVTELNVQVSWDAFPENEQQDALKPSAIELKKTRTSLTNPLRLQWCAWLSYLEWLPLLWQSHSLSVLLSDEDEGIRAM